MAGTTVYNINKPTVAGDAGVWGGFLNTGMDTIDNEIARLRVPWNNPTYNVGGTTTLDLNQTTGARVFVFTVSGASTLAFSNVPSASFDVKVTLLITNGGAFALTFPASVLWLTGLAPTLKPSGYDIVDLETNNAGGTWFATLRNPRPGVLFQATNKTTTSTSEVSLVAYTLPAGVLAVDGQALRMTVRGRQATQNAVISRIKFGATNLAGITPLTGENFMDDVILSRTGAATQQASEFSGHNVGGAITLGYARTAPTETLSGAITIDFRGNVVSGGTLTLDTVLIELLAAA